MVRVEAKQKNASIPKLQKDAKTDKEKPTNSSRFWDRLKKHMK